MKTLITIIICFISLGVFAQGTSINNTGAAPDPSAGLDVDFNDKGFLPPRLSTTERNAISSPAEGLVIYNTTTKCLEYFNGTSWLSTCGVCAPQPTAANAGPDQSGLSVATTLAANAPGVGETGAWTEVSGDGNGVFGSSSSATSSFDGTLGVTYVLQWSITNACGTSTDQVTIEFAPAATNYATGNEAYWTEKDLGYNDVTIGGGTTIYTYDAALKQYKNGTTILIPDKTGTPDGNTVDANNFYGLSGGSKSSATFNWDNQAAIGSSSYDVVNMFVSPASANRMTYCQALQHNFASTCDGGTSNVVIDGPNSTLAYSSALKASGTYDVYNHQEKFTPGTLKGTDADYFSQQQLTPTTDGSYCADTYGYGWRIPTDIEVGHTDDIHDVGHGFDDAYGDFSGSTVFPWMWTSSKRGNSPSASNYNLWIVNMQDGFWGWYGGPQPYHVRCVYPGY